MKVIKTGFENLLIIEPHVYNDSRGYFFESFNKSNFDINGLLAEFVQDNESYSEFGVIRGLHYQVEPYAQTKLVRVIKGRVLDVVVDIRKNSATFGKFFKIELSSENKLQLYIPKGFAHGFSVLSKYAILAYKCDNVYNKSSERGININDPFLSIDWKVQKNIRIISEKDFGWPDFNHAEYFIS
ncbi:MAG: dTDP-4-dehydrorhamnose 3,5-epimerase [Bacteroidales bacterium]